MLYYHNNHVKFLKFKLKKKLLVSFLPLCSINLGKILKNKDVVYLKKYQVVSILNLTKTINIT